MSHTARLLASMAGQAHPGPELYVGILRPDLWDVLAHCCDTAYIPVVQTVSLLPELHWFIQQQVASGNLNPIIIRAVTVPTNMLSN